MDQYLCLRATTRGNVQQNTKIRIEVCGDEVVTLADENLKILTEEYHGYQSEWTRSIEDLNSWLISSRDSCPFSTIVMGTGVDNE